MKRLLIGLAAMACLWTATMASAQMGMMQGPGMMRGPGMMGSLRHRYAMRVGIAPEYASRVNPLGSGDASAFAHGKTLYEANCAACHGASGLGDGVAGRGLNPPPANLAALARWPMATGGYLYWTIAEGGVLLGTPMPPFKGSLEEEEIWQIILYLRRL